MLILNYIGFVLLYALEILNVYEKHPKKNYEHVLDSLYLFEKRNL